METLRAANICQYPSIASGALSNPSPLQILVIEEKKYLALRMRRRGRVVLKAFLCELPDKGSFCIQFLVFML